MGNSEVGHTNLGAGRVVRQDLVRIDDDIESGAFFRNGPLVDACRHARGSALHLLGLVSDGGVHSHIRHLEALIELARREGVERVHVHAFTDGRDTSPHGAERYLDGIPGVATVAGRYYAMDRDRRWERAKRAYDAIVHGVGARADDAVEAVKASYAAGVTDEFIEPVVIGDPARGRIRSGDAAVFFNFRPDRARELSWALTKREFDGFDRGPDPPLPHYVQMTEYADDVAAPVAFPGEDLADVLAQVLASHGVGQLHVAETEKYAHVTYFFDGGSETRCAGEEWELVDSPRDVATYDQKPSMSAEGVADHVVAGLARRPLRVLPRQLREPRHGRPHRRHPGGRRGGRDRRPLPGAGRRGGRGPRRRLPRDRRPRERGDDAEPRRLAAHGPHHEPGAADRHRPRPPPPRGRPSGRHRPDDARPARRPGAGGDERRIAARTLRSRKQRAFRRPSGRMSILTRVFRTGTNTLALPQPDPDVLRLARRGDERAFAIIVRQYNGPVFNYVTRVLSGDRALAEDICQEVFMRVYQALPGFDGRCQFTTWLFQVAKHRVVDELRARERRGRPALELEAAPQLHLAVAPPDADDGMDAVWQAIGGLSVDLKMALLLRDLVGLSYAEIAEALDTTLATVKWRIYKARETVVAELLREGYDFGHRAPAAPAVPVASASATRPV